MKQITLIICLAAIIGNAGCKKNDNNNKPQFSDPIEGTWELRHASAAMNPQVSTPSPGNGNMLKFSATEYEKYEAHQLVEKGKYAIIPDPTVESSVCLLFPVGQFINRIEYDNDSTGRKYFMDFIKNRLVIVSGCYAVDAGYRLEYEKIAEPGH